MQRDVFEQRLLSAADRARDLASRYVVEPLPAAVWFRILLNQSNDDLVPLRPGEVVFPDDGGLDRAEMLRACGADLAVETLWRGGRVPEWIDVSVVDATDAATVLELLCCGRFTDDESLLYHLREGIAPFHVTSPPLPPGYTGGRFSVHWFAECWDHTDPPH
jgi:hypothetical protein